MTGNFVDEFRASQCGRVDADLVGSGIQQPVHIRQFVDSSSHSKGDRNLCGHLLHHGGKGLSSLMAGGNIQIHQFVGSLFAVRLAQFHRVACLAQIYKIRSFYGLSVFDVQTRYDSFR